MTKDAANNFDVRNRLLRHALDFTKADKGKKRDEAIFSYLCGACAALHATGQIETDCPPWLFVIGVRGGTRVEEAERMLADG